MDAIKIYNVNKILTANIDQYIFHSNAPYATCTWMQYIQHVINTSCYFIKLKTETCLESWKSSNIFCDISGEGTLSFFKKKNKGNSISRTQLAYLLQQLSRKFLRLSKVKSFCHLQLLPKSKSLPSTQNSFIEILKSVVTKI